MSRKQLTGFSILIAISIIGLWDLWVAIHADWSATTSYVVYHVAKENPIIPFLCGVIAGHLFWPLQALPPDVKS